MRYGKISEAIWADDKFQGLTDGSKLLYIYLLSCETCNCIGVFRIGLGMIEDGFGADRKQIGQNLQELQESGLIGYENGWLWFNKYLRWNEPTSPNHAKQCASYINDCVRREAPVEAIWGLLSTVHSILGGMGQKAQESGPARQSYFDVFIKSLNRDEVKKYLGGEELYQSCLRGQKIKTEERATEELGKTSESAHKGPKKDKGLLSTTEGLQKHYRSTSNTDKTITRQDNNKTSQDNDNKSIVLACNNKQEVTEISLYCSDGQVHSVSQNAIRSAAVLLPEFDMERFKAYIQKQNIISTSKRPEKDQEAIDGYFMTMAHAFAYSNGGNAT